MDAASCSILRAQPFSSTSAVFPPSNNPTARFFALPKNNPNLVPSFSSTFPRNSTFPGKWLHFDRFADFSSLSGAQDKNPSQELAVLLEVDGCFLLNCSNWSWVFSETFYLMISLCFFRVLMDAYRLGTRQTFNAAFKKLGLDCASWTEPVYLDLLRLVGLVHCLQVRRSHL